MKQLVIGISGKKASGKDLLGTYLSYFKWKRVAFADYLKSEARRLFGLTMEQTNGNKKETPTMYVRMPEDGSPSFQLTPRQIMIDVGQWFRSVDRLYWVKKAFEIVKAQPDGAVCYITDVRFKNEADFIKEEGGILIRLERSKETRAGVYPNIATEKEDYSETDLDDYDKFDLVLDAKDNVHPQHLEKFAGKVRDHVKKTLALH